MIFNIQKFATQDGSGIRSVIFFKGCPLHCLWCSNPESQSFDYELMYEKIKCISCRDCVKASIDEEVKLIENSISIDNSKNINSEKYKNLCPAKALNVIGEIKSIDGIMLEILKDKAFYETSKGGVTISGGEPFSQPKFLNELLSALHKNNISIFIETCLHVKWEHIEQSLKQVDCILGDLKHTDNKKYKQFTGGDVSLPLNNFRKLSDSNISTKFRIPVIPGFNDTIEEMTNILDFAASLKNINKVDLIPYHRFGKGKYQSLFRKFSFNEQVSKIPQEKLEAFLKLSEDRNLQTEIII
jgi:pyruvate formate lyase activating enzyme